MIEMFININTNELITGTIYDGLNYLSQDNYTQFGFFKTIEEAKIKLANDIAENEYCKKNDC